MRGKIISKDIEIKENTVNRREFLAGIGAGLVVANSNFSSAKLVKNMTSETEITDIDFLKKYSTSLLESAIYLLKGTHEGIVSTHSGLQLQMQNSERLVGYAVTSVFSTDPDDERGRRENADYWNYVFNQPGPKIAVSYDSSRNSEKGSSWGQQNAHIHKGLGCRGVLTNGGVRDIGVFQDLNFQVFSGSLTIGHGNPHFIEFGQKVTLYGAEISSGDVICADQHGAIVVPKEMLTDIDEAVAEALRRANIIAEYCRKADFSPNGLIEVTKKLKPSTPWKPRNK